MNLLLQLGLMVSWFAFPFLRFLSAVCTRKQFWHVSDGLDVSTRQF